jgi:hypothetical protein
MELAEAEDKRMISELFPLRSKLPMTFTKIV